MTGLSTAPGTPAPPSPSRDEVYAALADLGAPLYATRAAGQLPLEVALAEALRWVRTDATLLRALPVLLRRNRGLDVPSVVARAGSNEDVRVLGLLLELTGRLGDAPELLAAAARLPRHFTRPEFFFAPRGPRDRALVERRTPEVARAWGWLVNMPEESFASLLAKHA